jgi:prepilin-type processing-associated H-X9-DG protein
MKGDSINDGEFVVGMNGFPDKPQQWMIVDYPASYHNAAAGFSFVDGHSEIKNGRIDAPCLCRRAAHCLECAFA